MKKSRMQELIEDVFENNNDNMIFDLYDDLNDALNKHTNKKEWRELGGIRFLSMVQKALTSFYVGSNIQLGKHFIKNWEEKEEDYITNFITEAVRIFYRMNIKKDISQFIREMEEKLTPEELSLLNKKMAERGSV